VAQNDISAQEPLSKKSLTPSRRMEESLDIPFIPQNYQPILVTRRSADRHSILRAQIHTRHVDYVKPLIGMLLVVPLNCLLQFRQCTQVMIALHFLLALATGENELTLPRRRVGFALVCHSAGLDAVSL
jgi:hypothetical protein